MGYHKNVYVGPFIELNGNLPSAEKERKINFTICQNEECSIHGKNVNGKFCPECGAQVGKGTRIESYFVTQSIKDLMCDFGDEDVMYNPEYLGSVLIPNDVSSIRDIVIGSGEDDFVSEIPNTDFALDKFMRDEKYSKFMFFLDSVGVNYSVKYGLVSYWS